MVFVTMLIFANYSWAASDGLTAMLGEFSLIGGMSAERAIPPLQDLVRNRYHYDLKCDDGWWNALSSPACLYATRAFARALYYGLLPPASADSTVVLKVKFRETSTAQMEDAGDAVIAELPWNLNPQQMAASLAPVLLSSRYARRLFEQREFGRALANFHANVAVNLRFDDGLSLVQKWRGLNSLIQLAHENPRLLDSSVISLALVAAPSPDSPQPRGLTWEQALPYDFGADRMRELLGKPARSEVEKESADLRTELSQTIVRLEDQFQVSFACSPQSDLTLPDCVQASRRVTSLLQRYGQQLARHLHELVIVSPNETTFPHMDFPAMATRPAFVALHSNFEDWRFQLFAQGKGWIP